MSARMLVIVGVAALLAGCGQQGENRAGADGRNTAAVGDVAPVELEVPAGVYRLDRNHALLQWSVSHLGLSNYTARFTRYDATVALDPKNIEASRIELKIDPASVRTDFSGDYQAGHPGSPYETWDEAIGHGDLFLNGEKYPAITFTSTKVKRAGPNLARVTGDLTFLGVTKPVTMDVSVVGQSANHPLLGMPAIGFRAEGRFNRSDFGMEKGPIGDEVSVVFDGEFHPAPAATAAEAEPAATAAEAEPDAGAKQG